MRLRLLALIALLGLLFAGCGGGDDESAEQPTPAPSPATTPGGSLTDSPCQVPGDVTSYRFAMGMKMDVPGLEEALEEFERPEEALPTSEADIAGDGFDEFGEALAPLMGALLTGFTDMSVEGTFVAPDRSEARMKLGDFEVTTISIGDQEWTKLGDDTEWQETAGEGGDMSFSSDICEGFSIPELAGLEADEETMNGIASLHYHVDEAEITRLADLLGEDMGEMWDLEGMPEEVTYDLWVAEDGNWPVRMEAEVRGEDEEGNEMSLSFFMEIKDLNDPDIKIEPPTAD